MTRTAWDSVQQAWIALAIVIAVVWVGLGVSPAADDIHGKETGVTVTAIIPFQRALERAEEVWLAGLAMADASHGAGAADATTATSARQTAYDAVPSPPSAVYLRWAPDNSLWIPRWDLQLVAPSGWWPAQFVTLRTDRHDIITLAQGLSPQRDHTYAAAISYDDATGTVAVALHDQTAGTDVYAGHVRLTRRARLAYPEPADITAAYNYVSGVANSDTYFQYGLPLSMDRWFSWQWVLLLDGQAIPQSTYRFGQMEQPAIRVEWPPGLDSGAVLFHVYQEGKLLTTVTTTPKDNDHVHPLPMSQLPRGDSVVHVVYRDETGEHVMEETPLRIVAPEVRAAYKFFGRDNEANGRLDVVLRSDTHVRDIPLTLTVTYQSAADIPDDVQQVLRTVKLPADDSMALSYTLPLPIGAGRISLRLETTADVTLHGSTDEFHVAAAPLFQAWPVHPKLTARLGDPAVISPDDPAPLIAVYTTEDGTLQGTVWRDGRFVTELTPRPVAAATKQTFSFTDVSLPVGHYELRLEFGGAQRSVHFTVVTGTTVPRIVYAGDDGRLRYIPDFLGNKIPDFSYAGYGGGGVSLPDIPVQAVLEPEEGDATARVQAALDAVGGLPPDANGWRGAVLLQAGVYEISDTLRMDKSGVVLRGEGSGPDGTVLLATGNHAYDLIRVGGAQRTVPVGPVRPLTDMYVPVGGRSFHVPDGAEFNVGDTVIVRRHGNAAWIQAIGMDRITPRPTDPASTVQWTPFSLTFERVITAIEGNRITVDAPFLNAIETEWGGGDVAVVDDRRLEYVGVEHVRAVSQYDDSVTCQHGALTYACDEDHAQYVVAFGNVKHAWLSDVVSEFFSQGPAELGSGSKWVTVQDTRSLQPVSVIEGGKRYPYHMRGQLNLMQRLYSQGARHAFVVASRVTGPNVFLHAVSTDDYAHSEPHHRWSVGGLYDNVASTTIAIQDRQYLGTGHGWSGANYVAWNTTGDLILQRPATAHNWSIGHVGVYALGAFEPRDPGHRESLGQHVAPPSLYLQQLRDRMGPDAVAAIGY